MRKRILNRIQEMDGQRGDWLDLENIATVEVTSENPNFPIESAISAQGSGWRAAEPGEQVIRLVFDSPQTVHRLRLEFLEPEITRTQEFTLRYSRAGKPLSRLLDHQPASYSEERHYYSHALKSIFKWRYGVRLVSHGEGTCQIEQR